jgi:hypothetical protein
MIPTVMFVSHELTQKWDEPYQHFTRGQPSIPDEDATTVGHHIIMVLQLNLSKKDQLLYQHLLQSHQDQRTINQQKMSPCWV